MRSELFLWVQQGLISEETADQLRKNYQLATLKEESSQHLSSVIFTVGGLLLGGGVISLVAANWEVISDAVKLALLFSTLLVFHGVGYWLWHSGNWKRLGHALIFGGCLVFGANIGLIAQIFHIRGNWYAAFGAWSLGSLVMAWAIRSSPIGLLFVLTSFVWFVGFHDDTHSRLGLLYPLALAVFGISLAWTIRSRSLYVATAIGIVSSACVFAVNRPGEAQLLLALTAGGLALWTAGELHRHSGMRREFSDVSRVLGLSLLAVIAYVWSFRWPWRLLTEGRSMPSVWAIVFLVFSILGFLWLLRVAKGNERRLILGIFVAGATLSVCALLAMSTSVRRALLLAVLTNVVALILATIVVGMSLVTEQRAVFWLGTLYIVTLIFSRFLEYETSLLLKSAAFLACGLAIIFAGIRYERYIRQNHAALHEIAGKGA